MSPLTCAGLACPGFKTRGGRAVRRRLVLTITFMTAVFVLLGRAAASQAAPGSLRIPFAANLPAILDASIVPAIAAEPGVAKVDTVDTSKSTPSPATLATYDLVV